MTKALVIVAMSNIAVMRGDYMTVTFEGDEAANEAHGYINAMYSTGFWPKSTVFALSMDGQLDDFAFNADIHGPPCQTFQQTIKGKL